MNEIMVWTGRATKTNSKRRISASRESYVETVVWVSRARNSDYELSIFLLSTLMMSSSLSFVLLLLFLRKKRLQLNIYFSDRDKGIRHTKWSHLFLMRSTNSDDFVCIITWVCVHFIGINAMSFAFSYAIWLVLYQDTVAAVIPKRNKQRQKMHAMRHTTNQVWNWIYLNPGARIAQQNEKWRTDIMYVTRTINFYSLLPFESRVCYLLFAKHARTPYHTHASSAAHPCANILDCRCSYVLLED